MTPQLGNLMKKLPLSDNLYIGCIHVHISHVKNIMHLLCIVVNDAQFDLGLSSIFMKPIWILYTLYRANNNGDDQTA